MNILVVGGGFAGVKAARNLAADKRFNVTLMSDRDHFEYHAALYRTATGRSPLEVKVMLDEIFPPQSGVELVLDRASALDADTHELVGASGKVYKYDRLILALGVVTEYYSIKGLSDYAYGIKSIDEAMRLKHHLHEELTAGHKPDQHYVIVGGGPTGVELAGELVSYLKQLRKNHKRTNRFTVHLIEAAPRILPILPEDVARKVTTRLKRLGVKVHIGIAVQGETQDFLMLPGGHEIKTHLVVWTAGVANNPFYIQNAASFTLGRGKRVEVGPHMEAAKDVYVVGDSAATPKSGWAQTALHDADFVTTNLKRELDKKPLLHYRPHGAVGAIPVGPRWCAVAKGSFRAYGLSGWLLRRQADRRLFYRLLPRRLALRSWLSGSKLAEDCQSCQS